MGQNVYILFTLSVTNSPKRSCSLAAGRGAEPSSPRTGRVLLCAPLSAQLVAVRHRAVAALPNVTSMSFGPSAAMVLVQVRARPALLNDRAAQNHHAGARRSAQSLRVDVHGGLTTVSASRSFLAAAPPDPSSCARRGRWASADAAGPLHDPTGRARAGLQLLKEQKRSPCRHPGRLGGGEGTCSRAARHLHVDHALSGDVVELARSGCGPGPL